MRKKAVFPSFALIITYHPPHARDRGFKKTAGHLIYSFIRLHRKIHAYFEFTVQLDNMSPLVI
jgi:hypothetical protein